jgi:hypothetical protein
MLFRSNLNLLVEVEYVILLVGYQADKSKKCHNLEISNMLFRSNPNLLVEVEDVISLVGDQVAPS